MADIKLEGIQGLLEKVQQLGNNVTRIENNALKAGAKPVLDDAKATSEFHDRTGKLRKGLDISNVKSKNGTKYVLVGITKGDNSQIFYGKFIEFGTSKMPARPFLAPAFEKNKENIKETIKNELRKALGL